ncbi:putative holin-like toxin [Brevibacillus gelatini]|uniref:Putative holin-like toxin n=1 Tax=Brevibacillus gelatini TaxID=1655277 RepID=A0A3M8B0S7_9BACL|nr:putative holin-like toxin [Brevibacillus gelatini]RNB56557.1 putative holin-like toxin [Brevibacillus gelatini]
MMSAHYAMNLMIQFGTFVVALIALVVTLLNIGRKK